MEILGLCLLFTWMTSIVVSAVSVDQVASGLHRMMNSAELSHLLGVGRTSQVNESAYQVTYITTYRAVPSSASGWQPSDDDVTLKTDSEGQVRFEFSAFGSDYELTMQRNDRLVSPRMKSTVKSSTFEEDVPIETNQLDCHFLHTGEEIVAALSHCTGGDVTGLIFHKTQVLEVLPLSTRLQRLYSTSVYRRSNELITIAPHIIRLADPIPPFAQDGGCLLDRPEVLNVTRIKSQDSSHIHSSEQIIARETDDKSLELAVFLDEKAYRYFMSYFDNNLSSLRYLILAYMNGVQAIYKLPSLGVNVDLVIVYMEFHAKQPDDLPAHGGERNKLLRSFCSYQQARNPSSDSHSQHWDIGLYVSGLDFYAYENGRYSNTTMGLSTVTGVCTRQYNCVIAEFGASEVSGRPYPSTGFTSIYVTAHEIGHNLGMYHDGSQDSCPTEGFIMSPTRGTNGETEWSQCSARFLKNLKMSCLNDFPAAVIPTHDLTIFGSTPGQYYTSDEQCRLLLFDKRATRDYRQALSDICTSLRCQTPSRRGTFSSGPAVEGTTCGQGKWCRGGRCVPTTYGLQLPFSPPMDNQWWDEECKSGCVNRSIGTRTSRRNCDEKCHSSTRTAFCDDEKVCSSRLAPSAYATLKCHQFNQYLPWLDAPGIQARYNSNRTWQSCAIYCKRSDTGTYYTPMMELDDYPHVDTFFPDGTWCGEDLGVDHYCVHRTCIPIFNPTLRRTPRFHWKPTRVHDNDFTLDISDAMNS